MCTWISLLGTGKLGSSLNSFRSVKRDRVGSVDIESFLIKSMLVTRFYKRSRCLRLETNVRETERERKRNITNGNAIIYTSETQEESEQV